MGVGEVVLRILFVGMGATLIMDVFALIQARVFGIPSINYGLVGRWLGHMLQGRFRHDSIMTAGRFSNEGLVGWVLHYIIGTAFAMVLLCTQGLAWLCTPSLIPALLTGLISVIAPFFIMQPAFGFGIAASRTETPNVARRRSVIAHVTFGFGLYGAGWLLMRLFPAPLCLG